MKLLLVTKVIIFSLECFYSDLTHQVVRSRSERPIALIVFILIDMNCGEDLILQASRDQLCQTVGVGCENSLETFLLCMSDVFFLQKQGHLHILRCRQISRKC